MCQIAIMEKAFQKCCGKQTFNISDTFPKNKFFLEECLLMGFSTVKERNHVQISSYIRISNQKEN